MKYRTKKSYWQREITKREYLQAILSGLALLVIISYLFYGTVLVTILLLPYLFWHLKSWERQKIQQKKQQFEQQFKEGIHALSVALNVGYSAENALREAYRDLQILYAKECLIVREFEYMNHQLEMNVTMETVLHEFAERTGHEEVQLFVTVFCLAKRSGGDMLGIIKNAVEQIEGKIEVKREIETILSAKRLEFRIMSVIPIGMICYLKLSFQEFLAVLYGNLLGVTVMSICLLIYVVAYEFGKKIVEIEV